MTTLDSIEREYRKKIVRQLHEFSEVRSWRLMFIGFLVTPFLLAEAMFVPILGQLIFGLALFLTAFYLYRARSLKALSALCLGAACSIVLLSLFAKRLSENGPLIFYFTVGLCTAISIIYIIWIAGEIMSLYKRAEEGVLKK